MGGKDLGGVEASYLLVQVLDTGKGIRLECYANICFLKKLKHSLQEERARLSFVLWVLLDIRRLLEWAESAKPGEQCFRGQGL